MVECVLEDWGGEGVLRILLGKLKETAFGLFAALSPRNKNHDFNELAKEPAGRPVGWCDQQPQAFKTTLATAATVATPTVAGAPAACANPLETNTQPRIFTSMSVQLHLRSFSYIISAVPDIDRQNLCMPRTRSANELPDAIIISGVTSFVSQKPT